MPQANKTDIDQLDADLRQQVRDGLITQAEADRLARRLRRPPAGARTPATKRG
jgi:hypothetical protein